jgi:transcriptional regulator NrdR family protein
MAKCKHKNTFIINSRWLDEYKPFFLDEKLFSIKYRRRECKKCSERFTTYELEEEQLRAVVESGNKEKQKIKDLLFKLYKEM